MKFLTLFVSLLCLPFVSKTNALLKTEKRQVGPYEAVSIAGSYEVTLVEGKEGEITFVGAARDLERIVSKVKNGTLIIKNDESSWFKNKWMGPVEIEIPVESISKVNLSGSGSIESDFTLKSNTFKASVSGSGDIEVRLDSNHFDGVVTGSGRIDMVGRTHSKEVKITGSGNFDGEDLDSDKTKVIITGSGTAKVNAKDKLEALITGSGNVLCYGNPETQNIKTVGSGRVSMNR